MAAEEPNPATKDPASRSPPGKPSPLVEPTPDSDSDTDALLAQLESELDLSTSPDPPTTASAQKTNFQSQAIPPGRTILSTQPTGLHVPSSEESLIRATADAPAAVVLFYSQSFANSVRMKDLVSTLAQQYVAQNSGFSRERDGDDDGAETLFFAAEAERCEWLCRRLKVRVLPVVVGYVDGREVGRVVGFEGLRGGEGAGWQALGWVIGSWGGSWSGTMGKRKGGSVLGRRWMEWVSGGSGVESAGDLESDDESNEDEKEGRRRLGFIGGARTSQKTKTGRRLRRSGVAEDEDDDWD